MSLCNQNISARGERPALTSDAARAGRPAGTLAGLLGLAAALALTQFSGAARAATDISNVPLSSTSTTTAKPNIMFILDDSGSMAWEAMPDELMNLSSSPFRPFNVYGSKSAQCNGVAYNPAITYTPPVKVDATTGAVSNYADASFTVARSDGFNNSSGTSNLTNEVYYHYLGYLGSPPALSWRYASSGTVDTSTTFYTECMTAIPIGGAGNARFEKRTMTSTSTDAQNYANWYSFYRTRQLTMRSAGGRAFAGLSDAYRVGFTKINDTGVTGTTFLNASDFTTAQKSSFFNLLYTASAQNSTPLRAALSKVGRYYGNVISGQTYDPVQYSCQRNYAVLSTDGYWNGDNKGTRLDGSDIGQQDGTELRPMKDGAATILTITTTSSVTDQRTSTGNARQSTVYQRTRFRVENCSGSSGRRTTTRNQRRTDTAPLTRILVEDVPSTTVRIVVKSNDVTTSDTSRTTNGTVTTVSDTLGPPGTTSTGTWNNIGNDNRGSCIDPSSTPVGDTFGPESTVGTSAAWVGTPTSSTVPGTAVENTREDTGTSGGDSNSLADAAQYYWKTDLRPNMADNVPTSGDDSAAHQHMTTFTIGLGLKGTLNYDRNYLTQTTGDFADIRSGAKNWPVPAGTITSNTSDPENATHIDDLWHAAVNGRGQYFSAADPNQLDDAISTTLSAIRRVTESGAAAAASTLTPVSGDDWVFLPSFTTVDWTGDLRAFKFTFDSAGRAIAPNTAPDTEVWSAADRLDTRNTARRILFNNAGTLAAFTYDNLTSAGLNGIFDTRCDRALTSPATNLSHCSTLTTAARAKVTGANLVNFLAGDKSLYLSAQAADDRVFRTRRSLLGDFVNASPVYVGKPPFRYADAGYAAFATLHAERTKVVYAAANDGMLHAIKVGTDIADSTGGSELWAFVPTGSMSEMWRLADDAYATDHHFFVDATPNVSDVFDSVAGRWRTILVGGLGAGGRGYYALDVTDPASPALMWEFSDVNLGQTYSNPVITKDASGVWMVAFTSGTNNVASGDGVGRLYLVNAVTGALIRTVATTAGDATTPSNLGRLDGWIVGDTDNTAQRFYAGDMLGNIWRFDHDDRLAPAGREAVLLGQAKNAAGTAQPITAKPLLTEAPLGVGGSPVPLISFGTGRLLNVGDLSETATQTIYAFKDNLAETGLGVLRATGAALVPQTLDPNRRTIPVAPVDWSTKNGWYVDLTVSSKERVHLDGVQLGSGVLVFASTVPTADACSQGGVSYLYQFDLTNGNVSQISSYTSMIVGLGVITNNNRTDSAIVTTNDQRTSMPPPPDPSGSSINTLRRSSWRELTTD